ncbi:MAG: PocR ligand-binding domain-containing protein [Bacillota bacterium]
MAEPISDSNINYERAKNALDAYGGSVGIGAFLIDLSGKTLIEANPVKRCKICGEMPDKGRICANAHLYGGYQAERFGGKYIFFCPVGLVHWASPVIAEGSMQGVVLGGPVLMTEPDDLLLDEIMEKGKIDSSKSGEIERLINEIPVVDPEVVNKLSELLFIVSLHISDVSPSYYQETRELLEQQSRISDYIRHIKTMGGELSETESYPIQKEKELLSLISLGDKAGSQKVLNEILGHLFFVSGGDFKIIKARILELIVLLSRAALEGGADVEQIFGLNYKYLSQIHDFETVDELTYWLSGILNRFTDCVFNLTNVKHIDVIYKAIDYIKRNYMKKITLEDVANHVQLSTSYFCSIFKAEMKCSFNAYLNKIRIEMSKKLLEDHTIPLVDVAYLVGYEDQSYFSKVFKSRTGISPGKYRERKGQARLAQ